MQQKYFWDAMVLVGEVYNLLPTDSNRLGKGEAPDHTLGLPYDLSGIVPLGSPGVLKVVGLKNEDVMEFVVILGYNSDGLGYRVLKQDGTIVTSVHVRVDPDNGAFKDELAAARKDPSGESKFIKDHFNLDGGVLNLGVARGRQLQDITDSDGDGGGKPPAAVRVGDAPGMAGSRFVLNPRAPPPSPEMVAARRAAADGKGAIMTKEEADSTIADSRAAGHVFRWLPGFRKSGISDERFQYYRLARTWQQFDATCAQTYMSGMTGTQRPKATNKDLRNDVMRGILTFIFADTPVSGLAHIDPDDDLHEGDIAVDGGGGTASDAEVEADGDDGEADNDDDNDDDDDDDDDGDDGGRVPLYSVAGTPWAGRLRGHVATSVPDADLLNPFESDLLVRGFANRSAYVDLPEDVVLTAAAMTAQKTPFSSVPKSLVEAMRSPDWPKWHEALRKEIAGLKAKGAWTEVEKSAMPEGVTAAQSQLLFNIKKDGTYKVRFVARGDLTTEGVHYLESKSSMAHIESVRMLLAFAAGEGWKLHQKAQTKHPPNTS
jgi:hypothetical protein